MIDDRYLTACHEAGHAVAALMSGGRITSITIDPTLQCRGRTSGRCTSFDNMFVIYAGPWAEARAQWRKPMLDEDGVDDDGCTFRNRIAVAFEASADGDGAEYLRARKTDPLEMARSTDQRKTVVGLELPDIFDREKLWSRELECAWPVIEHMADRLLAGPLSTADATKLMHEA
jgi:Peptidase M50B-like